MLRLLDAFDPDDHPSHHLHHLQLQHNPHHNAHQMHNQQQQQQQLLGNAAPGGGLPHPQPPANGQMQGLQNGHAEPPGANGAGGDGGGGDDEVAGEDGDVGPVPWRSLYHLTRLRQLAVTGSERPQHVPPGIGALTGLEVGGVVGAEGAEGCGRGMRLQSKPIRALWTLAVLSDIKVFGTKEWSKLAIGLWGC